MMARASPIYFLQKVVKKSLLKGIEAENRVITLVRLNSLCITEATASSLLAYEIFGQCKSNYVFSCSRVNFTWHYDNVFYIHLLRSIFTFRRIPLYIPAAFLSSQSKLFFEVIYFEIINLL